MAARRTVSAAWATSRRPWQLRAASVAIDGTRESETPLLSVLAHDQHPRTGSGLRSRPRSRPVAPTEDEASFSAARFHSSRITAIEEALVAPIKGRLQPRGYRTFGSRLCRLLRILASDREVVFLQLFYFCFIAGYSYQQFTQFGIAKQLPTALVARDLDLFWSLVWESVKIFAVAWALVRIHFYVRARMPIAIRRVLTDALQERYARHLFAIQSSVGSSPGATKPDNVDQRICEDCEVLSRMLSLFATQFNAHVVECVVFSVALSATPLGSWAWTGLLLAFGLLSFLLTLFFVKQIAVYTYAADRREGDFRFAHGRLRKHAEAVAFFGAGAAEQRRVDESFTGMLYTTLQTLLRRIPLNILSSYTSHSQNDLVYIVLAAQVLYAPFGGSDGSNMTAAELNQNISLTVSYTSLVLGNIIRIFAELYNEGPILVGSTNRVMELYAELEARDEEARQATTGGSRDHMLLPGEIELVDAAVASPAGETLVRGLNLRMRSRERLLCTGRNGVGKSGFARTLVGVEPLAEGTLQASVSWADPRAAFVVPQRAFIPRGTLRVAIAFPSVVQSGSAETDDNLLWKVLSRVGLADVARRSGGLDSEIPWDDVLSVGERQRLVLARLMYHAPRVMLLDEPTSATPSAFEAKFLRQLLRTPTSVVFIGPTRLAHHFDRVLTLKGGYAWSIEPGGHAAAAEGAAGDDNSDAFDEWLAGPSAGYLPSPRWSESAAHSVWHDEVVARADAYVKAANARSKSTSSVYSCRSCRRLGRAAVLVASSGRVSMYLLFASAAFIGQLIASSKVIGSTAQVKTDITARQETVWADLGRLLALVAIVAAIEVLSDFLTGTRDSNSGDRFSSGYLGLLCRDKLQRSLHAAYFDQLGYYDVATSREIDVPDQRVVEDAKTLVYSAVTLFFTGLLGTIGGTAILSVTFQSAHFGYAMIFMAPVHVVVVILALLYNIPWTRMSYAETAAEAAFRDAHKPIAMQAGAATMGIELKARLHATLACAWRVARFGFITTSITEVFITIVAATATALVPWFIFFHWKFAELTGTEVQQLQTLSVLSLALDFITSRVYTLAALLGDLPSIVASGNRVFELLEWLQANAARRAADEDNELEAKNGPADDDTVAVSAIAGAGVALVDVTVCTPDDRVVVEGLSLLVSPPGRAYDPSVTYGRHSVPQTTSVLIMGPSGCGKTSILRVIAGLWQQRSGAIAAPPRVSVESDGGHGGMFFLPQTPFVVEDASLREQVWYPTIMAAEAGGRGLGDDVTTVQLLQEAGLGHVLERCGDAGLDGKTAWDALSLGEQQRLAMVRLLVHRPSVAVVDECTSAVTDDAQDWFYRKCATHGIAMISVGHKDSLAQLHDAVLTLDGNGGFSLQMRERQAEPRME